MKILLKFKIFIWYLSKPKYYNQLFFLLKKKIIKIINFDNSVLNNKYEYTENIEELELLKKLFYLNKSKYIDLRIEYSNIYQNSLKKFKDCPVSMGGESDLNLLFNITTNLKPKKIIETGVAYGWSTLAFLLAIKHNNDGKLVSIDMPYPGLNNEEYVGHVVPDELKKNWSLIRMADIDGIPIAIKKYKSFDLCHYDSDKSYQGRMKSYPILWNALNKNGIFISDDISDNKAFSEFLMQINKKPFIIKYKEQFLGIIIK